MNKQQILNKIKAIWKEQDLLENKIRKYEMKAIKDFNNKDLLDVLKEEELELGLKQHDLENCENNDK